MKPSLPIIALLSVGAAFAQDLETVKPAVPPAPQEKAHRKPEHNREHQPAMQPTTYLGVMARPAGEELRAQLDLPEGFGLVVMEVQPDSPAAAAGVKKHDVLTKVGDQRLVSMEQLSAIIRAEKKGSSVSLTLIHAGEEQKVDVTLGERMMPKEQHRPQPWFNGNPGQRMQERMENLGESFKHKGGDVAERMKEFTDKMRDLTNDPRLRDKAHELQERMKEFGERMKDWAKDPAPLRKPQPPAPNPPKMKPRPEGDHQRVEQKHSQSRIVSRSDESGSYSLSDDGHAKVFTASPKDGEPQTFIVNTEKQRDAMPEALRGKLRELEGSMKAAGKE